MLRMKSHLALILLLLAFKAQPLTRKGHAASVSGKAANGCAVVGLHFERGNG